MLSDALQPKSARPVGRDDVIPTVIRKLVAEDVLILPISQLGAVGEHLLVVRFISGRASSRISIGGAQDIRDLAL